MRLSGRLPHYYPQTYRTTENPHIYVSPISKCQTHINHKNMQFSWVKKECELAVFFSHSHNLTSYIVISHVVSLLIHQIVDLHIFIFYILVVLVSFSGSFSERHCGCHLFKRLSPSLSVYSTLREQLHHSCHSGLQRCLWMIRPGLWHTEWLQTTN